jgi:DNA polymerase I-like protein with 3'-5' exonuclease and polymerase domains
VVAGNGFTGRPWSPPRILSVKQTIAIDFEAFYDKNISVVTMGAYKYARATDIYLVAMCSDEWSFVGHPETAPWDRINGAEWVMHNAAFDYTLLLSLIEEGTIPKVVPTDIFDTADLAAFLGYPRSLKEASKHLLGVEVKKTTRDQMNGKQWTDMTPEFKREVCEYALLDTKNTLNIWTKHGDKWPPHERQISKMTREMGMRGVPVNSRKLRDSQQKLTAACQESLQKLPWIGGDLPPLSLQAIRNQCEVEGIWAPASFSEKDPEGLRWEEEFAPVYPWVTAVRDFRKANKHLKTVNTMLSRAIDSGDEVLRMPYELKYFGAATGRDSGGGGWNCQNIPRGTVAGVDLRNLIEAPENKTLIIADLAQIEARCICYLARDKESLRLMEDGADVYEAHARATMGYSDPRPLKDVDPQMRQLAKARVLGLGYGCGAAKFKLVAKLMAGLDIGEEESEKIVREYRKQNPKIVGLWGFLEGALKDSLDSRTLEITLPSNRTLRYYDVVRDGGFSALLPKDGKMMRCKLYGGLLAENITQGFARDVFMDRCRELESEGFQIILRVHDEVVVLVDEQEAAAKKDHLLKIMGTAPSWCRGLPLGADAHVSKMYRKA